MYILKHDIKLYNDVKDKKDIACVMELPKTPQEYAELPFFKNWIVGFSMSDGSFFIKSNNDACFQLKQKLHVNLFEAFKLVFNTSRKIETEKGLYNQFGVSSRADIQKVIKFFSFSGAHPLVGLKNIQYIKWLNLLRSSLRYTDLCFPCVVQ